MAIPIISRALQAAKAGAARRQSQLRHSVDMPLHC